MIDVAPVLTDLYISILAVFGLWLVRSVLIQRDDRDPLASRFLFIINVMTGFYLCRAAYSVSGLSIFGTLVLIAAALIPLGVILIGEGLVRRHAPKWVKHFAGWGTVISVLVVLLPLPLDAPFRLGLLLAFQVVGLLIGGGMVFWRDKVSLSHVENKIAERIALSVFLLLPLGAGDFLLPYMGLEFRGSGIAILLFCWLALSLGNGATLHRNTIAPILSGVILAMIAGSLLSVITKSGLREMVYLFGIVLSTTLIFAVQMQARMLRRQEHSMAMLKHLARPVSDDPIRSFQIGLSHLGASGSVVLQGEVLNDYKCIILNNIFLISPIVKRSGWDHFDAEQRDHLETLFARYSATHIVLVDQDPMVLVALSLPMIGAGERVELELAALQRQAALLGAKNVNI